jgi:hypothetical protein
MTWKVLTSRGSAVRTRVLPQDEYLASGGVLLFATNRILHLHIVLSFAKQLLHRIHS